eukprot:3629235-Amphidinium_carterae.1
MAYKMLSVVLVLLDSALGFEILRPIEVEHAALANGHVASLQRHDLEIALGKDGVVSITKIPGFAELRCHALREAHACISKSPNAHSHTFEDGTMRNTLAADSNHVTGLHEVDHGNMVPECKAWDATAAKFRSIVADSVDLFGKFLDDIFGLNATASLLDSSDGEAYSKISDIVFAGDRLEHFHSYSLPTKVQSAEQTIDFHVDQGVFIAFTPALVLPSATEPAGMTDDAIGGTFTLRRADGSEADVVFNPDSLVILAGDSLQVFMHGKQPGLPVHAPMHAFRVPQVGCEGCYRLWYGMMQLPPANALHEASGLTFGELRQAIIDATSSEDSAATVGLGCSRSPDACAAEGLEFNCTSQWDQLWLPEHGHGDFNPACTNSTSLVTPLPIVPQPSETDDCTGFMELVNDNSYAHRTELSENVLYMLWNVVGDAVEVKMVHNGRAGWLSVGINMGGGQGGMYGAHIVMGQYNPDSSEPLTVEEYRIHDSLSAYRHWKTPYSPSALTETMMSVTECYSTMAFKTGSIYGEALNVTSGTNKLIWGLTQNAYVTDEANGYAAYHGFGNRGHLEVEFTSSMTMTTSQETAGAIFAAHLSAVVVLFVALSLQ